MKILITGAGGLVGSALLPHLQKSGCQVFRLVRFKGKSSSDIFWDPKKGALEVEKLEGLDGVVHLAGENLAARRWSTAQKQRIRDSRVLGTKLLSESIAQLKSPPKVLLSASAVGFYGNRGDTMLMEDSSAGTGFLADVCKEWESATAAAEQSGVRVAHLRFGVILSPHGGALRKMLLPFRLGLGGPIGNGQQYWSWIAIEDVVAAIDFLLREPISGPVNVVSPIAVTNLEFTRTLGRVLARPTILPAPAALLRLALGEMADEALLSSTRVKPENLLNAGFKFQFTRLEAVFQAYL